MQLTLLALFALLGRSAGQCPGNPRINPHCCDCCPVGICESVDDALNPQCAACSECHGPNEFDPTGATTYACPPTATLTANPTTSQPTTTTGIFRAGDNLTLTSEGSIIANGLDLVANAAATTAQISDLQRELRALRAEIQSCQCSGEAPTVMPTTVTTDTTNCEPDLPGAVCNASAVMLDDFEVWRREEGYWIGEYTLTGSDGTPFQSSTWNYPYGQYKGFIHLELNGPSIRQRNVFLYPPSTDCDGANNVTGDGVCGINGNEKIFAADQTAADCDGNLAGPYQYGAYTVDTETTVTVGASDTVIYQVRLPAAYGGALIQNQLTSLPTPTKRTRTAQGFNPATGDASYASFYRETKVSQSEFADALVAARAAYNILPEDYCGWTDAGPSGKTCQEHFDD